MVSWGDLKPVLVPIMVTIVVTTVLVMGVSGRTAQFVLKKEEKKGAAAPAAPAAKE